MLLISMVTSSESSQGPSDAPSFPEACVPVLCVCVNIGDGMEKEVLWVNKVTTFRTTHVILIGTTTKSGVTKMLCRSKKKKTKKKT